MNSLAVVLPPLSARCPGPPAFEVPGLSVSKPSLQPATADVAQPRPCPQQLSIDAVLARLSEAPVATSRGRDWRGVTVDACAPASMVRLALPAYDHHLVAYCSTTGGRFIQRRAGQTRDSRLSAGMSILMPAGHDAVWEGEAPASIRIRVPVALVEQAASEIGSGSCGSVELLNDFGVRDMALESFARILADELERPQHPAQYLIIDSVSAAIAAHLLRNYNAASGPLSERPPVLSRKTIADIIDYIEEHLDVTIRLHELAAIAGVSRFHFARLFKNSLGETPMRYVEGMRIDRAKSLIHQGGHALVDIALSVGFADQSHFTRRFTRHVGCPPAAYARGMGLRPLSRR